MDLFLTILLFLVGLVLIVKGGDFFVDAASWIAEVSGIPKLIVGATVVSLATTLPELLVSLIAAFNGSVDMAVGNAVGSVTANIGLIMALSLLFMPTVIHLRDYLLKSILMLSAAAIMLAFGLTGSLGIVPSVLLIAVFAAAMWENVHQARASMRTEKATKEKREKPDKKTIWINVVKFVLGTAGIVGGAQLMVDNGTELARLIGISERVISVTIIAVGTSLPELVTTITAIIKKQSSLSVGNIIGANIIDLTLIMPLAMLVSGKALPLAPTASTLDIPAALVVGGIALVPTLITRKFQRWQGIVLLLVYAGYLVLTVTH